MGFILNAPAKINLYLKVVSRRADGYHNILSLMQMIDLYDTLTFYEDGAHLSLLVKNGDVPPDQSNLVLRAARMLQKEMALTHQVRRGARITLDKRIPVAAGLGGGSSDAAAALIGLNRLWSLGLSRKRLSEIGGWVGSDVPFFFYGPTAWVSGKGEQVRKMPSRLQGFVVLVYSENPVLTASVYHQIGEAMGLPAEGENEGVNMGMRPSIESILVHPHNDLEKVTLNADPELIKVKGLFKTFWNKEALMSGSGPTIFAHFDTEDQAQSAASVIRKEGYKAVGVAKLLSRVPRGFGILQSSCSDTI